uniref:Tyrosine-type recombinase/integrase n=1 Tax=Aromatoleum buckelii TaxID=200254 RepID=A0ABX1N5Z3_9RHOO
MPLAFKHVLARDDIAGPAPLHTLQHSFGTALLQKGHDIRAMQGLLGHSEVSTAMI